MSKLEFFVHYDRTANTAWQLLSAVSPRAGAKIRAADRRLRSAA